MLDDKDRNLQEPLRPPRWGLEGARRRGAWDGTKSIIDKGRDWIISEMKASGLLGAAGPAFDRAEMVVHAKESTDGRPSYLVSMPTSPSPHLQGPRKIMRHDPHLLVEGCLLASFRDGCACLLHLCARRIQSASASIFSRDRPGL